METFLIEVPIPSMGATVAELTVIDILTEPGKQVNKGQKLAELESDKSAFEFEAPGVGVIESILVRAGDIVPAGSPLLRMQTSDESLRHLEVKTALADKNIKKAATQEVSQVSKETAHVILKNVPVAASSTSAVAQWTPRAAKIAQEAGLDPALLKDISATGAGGRVSGEDIERYIKERGISGNISTPKMPSTSEVSMVGQFLPFKEETVCVAGIGYAVPSNIRGNKEILKAFPNMTEEEVIKLTGISERRYAGPDETATSLAATAVKQALEKAKISVDEIDGIIMATLIPDQPVPSMASALAKLLGVKTALAFDLNAACAGWLYALEVGRAFIRGGTAKKLIVVTAELLSRITNTKDHATAFLFGDGAGAAILTDALGGHRLNHLHLSGDPENFDAIRRTGGGALQLIPKADGGDREDFYLKMDGAVVFKSAVRAFADLIENTLARHQLKPGNISWVVPHQANERILRAVSKRVGIPYERFVVTIGKYGNTSAASVSMALGWAAQEGIFNPGDKIIFCSVGAGFTFAGGLLTW